MRIVGSQTPRSELLVQTEWLPYGFQPYFFARDTLSTDIVPSIGSSIASTSVDPVVPPLPLRSAGEIWAANVSADSSIDFSSMDSADSSIDSSSMDSVVPSSPLRSAEQIGAANVSEEFHSVPDNDWLEEPN